MALEGFNGQEAEAALKRALSENADLVKKFNEANNKIKEAFDIKDGVVAGKMADIMGNAWADASGTSFTEVLQKKTEDFLSYRVSEILQLESDNASKTETAYSNLAQEAK